MWQYFKFQSCNWKFKGSQKVSVKLVSVPGESFSSFYSGLCLRFDSHTILHLVCLNRLWFLKLTQWNFDQHLVHRLLEQYPEDHCIVGTVVKHWISGVFRRVTSACKSQLFWDKVFSGENTFSLCNQSQILQADEDSQHAAIRDSYWGQRSCRQLKLLILFWMWC